MDDEIGVLVKGLASKLKTIDRGSTSITKMINNISKTMVSTNKKHLLENVIPHLERVYNIHILLMYVSGSHMYGTATEKSDIDIRFVYIQPTEEILKGNYREQIELDNNNFVGFEFQRYLHLLEKNNPNMLESLDIPEDCVVFKHPSMSHLTQDMFLTKTIRDSLVGYAISQIKKARGLNKKMNNPIPKDKKSLSDFAYVVQGRDTVPLPTFCERYIVDLSRVAMFKYDNGKGLYGMYYSVEEDIGFKGFCQEGSTTVSLSEIPSEFNQEEPYVVYVNYNGYLSYCKEYKEYWEWVENRNEERYKNNKEAGQNVDLKNTMHMVRLLDMAENIAKTGKLKTRSENVQYLREVREGKYNYDELIEEADNRIKRLDKLFENCDLPTKVNKEKIKETLLTFRKIY